MLFFLKFITKVILKLLNRDCYTLVTAQLLKGNWVSTEVLDDLCWSVHGFHARSDLHAGHVGRDHAPGVSVGWVFTLSACTLGAYAPKPWKKLCVNGPNESRFEYDKWGNPTQELIGGRRRHSSVCLAIPVLTASLGSITYTLNYNLYCAYATGFPARSKTTLDETNEATAAMYLEVLAVLGLIS